MRPTTRTQMSRLRLRLRLTGLRSQWSKWDPCSCEGRASGVGRRPKSVETNGNSEKTERESACQDSWEKGIILGEMLLNVGVAKDLLAFQKICRRRIEMEPLVRVGERSLLRWKEGTVWISPTLQSSAFSGGEDSSDPGL